MPLLMFIVTWHPLKLKRPGEQLPRGLLSWDYEKKSSLDCFGDGDGLIVFLSNSGGEVLTFRYCWWHCKHFIFITRIICIKTTFRAVTCDVFLFHILEIQKILIFERLFLLQSGLLFFYLRTILLMVFFFSFCSTLCLLCWPPWLDFYTKLQVEEYQ